MFQIGKQYTFSSAHQLVDHDGKCRRPHGHNYRVEVILMSAALQSGGPKNGMVRDFADLDAIMKPVIEILDHEDINERLPALQEVYAIPVMKTIPTTAEHLAATIFHIVRAKLDRLGEYQQETMVWQVKVWETDKCWAAYSP